MPRALLFDENNVPIEVLSGSQAIQDFPDQKLTWINLRSNDDVRRILPDVVDKSRGFTEDLLEEQRPRVAVYQTLEDNEDTFSVIVLTLPTSRIFNDDDFQLQITFIILDRKIYSVGSKESGVFSEIMAKILTKKKQFTLTTLFAYIASELFEMSIDVSNQIEEYIDHTEGKQLKSGLERGWLASLLTLKSRLFDANKLVRADLEHIREIMDGEVPEFVVDDVGDHMEDRLLYLTDYIETLREELSNLINLNLAIASQLMNRQFYWLTIIGSLLVIPTIISGIWGMNIPVPQLNFWLMMGLILALTTFFGLLVRLFLPRPPIS